MASADVLSPNHTRGGLSISPARHEEFKATLLRLSPLVSVDRIKDHLLFVGAWVRFYQEAEDAGTLSGLLARGVRRLELWLERVVSSSSISNGRVQPCELPPFDVAMLLHACMLSPHRYYEDGLTRFPQLLSIGAFPLEDIATLIDPRTYLYKATPEQIKYWEEHTDVPFDPLKFRSEIHDATIGCPSCLGKLSVAWENNGLGYGESGFLHICAQCDSAVSRNNLYVAKLIKDLSDFENSDEAVLRGTLLGERGEVELSRARLITLHVSKTLRKENGSLSSPSELSMSMIFQKLTDGSQTKLRRDRIADLLRPYMQSTPFTHDLASAVVSLLQFHLDIVATGGCNANFLNGPCTELNAACDKYGAFLELIAFPEGTEGAVPSLDLDLVWHTHQLQGLTYRKTIVELTGIYADHVSCTEDPEFFEEADKDTQERWAKTYGDTVSLHGPIDFSDRAHSAGDLLDPSLDKASVDAQFWAPRVRCSHCHDCKGAGCTKCGGSGKTNPCGNRHHRGETFLVN
ncbi:hypothetical protein M0805_000256 [Coniferiporia weirii]|nr:hypothetical protein M0805_000256 [Coniferiporia weirii]